MFFLAIPSSRLAILFVCLFMNLIWTVHNRIKIGNWDFCYFTIWTFPLELSSLALFGPLRTARKKSKFPFHLFKLPYFTFEKPLTKKTQTLQTLHFQSLFCALLCKAPFLFGLFMLLYSCWIHSPSFCSAVFVSINDPWFYSNRWTYCM